MSNLSQQFLKHLCFSYSQYQVFVDYTEYSAQNNCDDEFIIFKNSEGKTYTARPLKQKSFYSLSKWSNYPFFIFLCPKIVSVKIPNTLNYPNSIRKILAMSQNFFENIAKSKNLCFFLHKNIFTLFYYTKSDS